jgi:hypothetical protein
MKYNVINFEMIRRKDSSEVPNHVLLLFYEHFLSGWTGTARSCTETEDIRDGRGQLAVALRLKISGTDGDSSQLH